MRISEHTPEPNEAVAPAAHPQAGEVAAPIAGDADGHRRVLARMDKGLAGAMMLQLQQGYGNAYCSRLVAGAPGSATLARNPRKLPDVSAGLVDVNGRPISSGKNDDPKEKEGEKSGDDGLFGVLSKVNGVIEGLGKLHEAWDKVFKDEVKRDAKSIPPLMSDETKADLDRALRWELSRLICQYVFEKAKFYDIDIKQLVDERNAKKKAKQSAPAAPAPAAPQDTKGGAKGSGKKAPASAAEPKPVGPEPADDGPNFARLEKDLEGLNELAMSDLKDQAVKAIATRKHSKGAPQLKPERFWWNENDDSGTYPSEPPPVAGGVWTNMKILEYGDIWFSPRIGFLDGPVDAGLHPDVKYFNIPVIGAEVVKPRWYVGGDIEGFTHGRNVNAVTIDKVEPLPDENKPMGQYEVHATFDWDESNTFLTCKLYAGEQFAHITDIDKKGEPDVGWF